MNSKLKFLVLIILFNLGCSSPTPIQKNSIESEVKRRDFSDIPSCCDVHHEFLGIVVLDKVCLTETETRLELFTKELKKVCVLEEGMLFQDQNSKDYAYLGATGVEACPKRIAMKDKRFELKFERIPLETKSIRLLEDKKAKYSNKPWTFPNVDLSHCIWN